MKSGEQYSRRVDHAKGSPGNPLSTEELLAKFRDCAKTALHPEGLKKSIDCLLNVETINPVNLLLKLLSGSDTLSR
jgi:2-methylcitrate dehydratase PrpD